MTGLVIDFASSPSVSSHHYIIIRLAISKLYFVYVLYILLHTNILCKLIIHFKISSCCLNKNNDLFGDEKKT